MRVIVIVVLVVAAIVMLLGVINHSREVDVGYGAGTWPDVSFVAVAGVVAGLVLIVGVASAAAAAAAAAGDRRKLETELERTYARLRSAEAAAPPVVGTGDMTAGPSGGGETARASDQPAAAGTGLPAPATTDQRAATTTDESGGAAGGGDTATAVAGPPSPEDDPGDPRV